MHARMATHLLISLDLALLCFYSGHWARINRHTKDMQTTSHNAVFSACIDFHFAHIFYIIYQRTFLTQLKSDLNWTVHHQLRISTTLIAYRLANLLVLLSPRLTSSSSIRVSPTMSEPACMHAHHTNLVKGVINIACIIKIETIGNEPSSQATDL